MRYMHVRYDIKFHVQDKRNKIYRVSQKKRNGGYSALCNPKVSHAVASSPGPHRVKHLLMKRMIPRTLNLLDNFDYNGHFLKHSNFHICLICVIGKGLNKSLWPAIHVSLFCLNQWKICMGFPQTMNVDRYTRGNFLAKWNGIQKWLSRNGHRIKTTRPNSMILVSFFVEEDFFFIRQFSFIYTAPLDRKVPKTRRYTYRDTFFLIQK